MMALERQYHDELNKELHGVPHSSSVSNIDNHISGKETEDKEEFDDDSELAKLSLSRRKRGNLEAAEVNLLMPSCYFHGSYKKLQKLHVLYIKCNNILSWIFLSYRKG